MATRGCNFCGKVGIQPIRNEQTGFNYSCLEVKKKEEKNETVPSKDESQVRLFKGFMFGLNFIG
jgi:hypothetical protein